MEPISLPMQGMKAFQEAEQIFQANSVKIETGRQDSVSFLQFQQEGDGSLSFLQGAQETGKTLEKKSQDFLNGKADLLEVISAFHQAEVLVDSLVALRNRALQSYEAIINMPL